MSGSSAQHTKALLSNRSYDALKKSTTVILPAIGALYFALAQIWQLPKPEEVVGSIAAVNVFLGVLMGVSTKSYNKSDTKKYAGVIEVSSPPDGSKKVFSLNLNEDPEDIEFMDEVTFRVDTDTIGNSIIKP